MSTPTVTSIAMMQRWLIYLCCFVIITSHLSTAVSDIQFQVQEERDTGHVVGDMSTDWTPALVHTDDLRYSIDEAATNDDVKELFDIEPITGVLTTAQVIDRDVICKYLDTCMLSLQIGIISSTLYETVDVSVEVLDINDNRPFFRSNTDSIGIPEGTAINTPFPLTEAHDIDSGENGVQSYDLRPPSDQFNLTTERNIDGSMDVQLVVLQTLDREIEDSYTLYLVASDNGTPVLSSSMMLNVTIMDANDNIATFTQEHYEFNVAEDMELNQVIATVQANDPDAGDAGRVIYQFSARSQDLYGSIFSINQNGEIFMTTKLDYETQNSYELTVSASDSAPNARKSDAVVTINVIDVNDFSPQISVTTLPNSAQAEVVEGAPVNSFIAHVSVIDRDSDVSGDVTCTLNNPSFRLESEDDVKQFRLLTAVVFDRERITSAAITITCRDHGSPALTSAKIIDVAIQDINDNSPVFDKSLYPLALHENNVPGVSITSVTARDPDYGQNARIQYSIDEPEYQTLFEVDRNGMIIARRSLDHEQQQVMTFHVTARDAGTPSRSAKTTIQIQLLDVNDSPPVFTQSTFEFSLEENRVEGVFIGQLTATDADSGPYDVIRYRFEPETFALKTFFNLDRDSGLLTSNAMFDRERSSEYNFIVLAYNQDQPKLNSTAAVTVTINDVNDMQPRFIYPSPSNRSLTIARDLGAGEFVVQARATDLDQGNNAWLSYSLSTAGDDDDSGDSDGIFMIAEHTGAISVTRDLSKTSQQTFNLTIVVRDHGDPPLSSQESLVVWATGSRADSSKQSKFPANMAILISLVSISGILMILLLAAILWLVYKSRFRKRKTRYSHQRDGNGDSSLGAKVEIIDRLDALTGSDMNTSFRGADQHLYDYQQKVRELAIKL